MPNMTFRGRVEVVDEGIVYMTMCDESGEEVACASITIDKLGFPVVEGDRIEVEISDTEVNLAKVPFEPKTKEEVDAIRKHLDLVLPDEIFRDDS